MRTPYSLSVVSMAALCFAGGVDSARADVAVSPPFASHMVLQRDMANPIWGTASGVEQVSVTVGDQTKTTSALANGTWRLELEPMTAGGPFTMTIEGGNTVTLSDIYVGEVWQAAGQSNMDTRLSYYPELASEIAAADRPMLRYFTVRQPGNPPTTWEVVSPATAGDLSALAYYFGKEIEATTGAAVGLVVTAVGGTTIASWLDPDTLAANPSITNDDRGTMWNEWVAPVVTYGIRGTVWIQGEQNCNSTDAPGYGDLFELLISGWREAWGQGEFPFYYGQLSNIHDLQTDPNNTSYVAMVREGQRMALALSGTAMSVNMDIGRANDWHFPNKPEAGRRLSLPARALTYGESALVYSGPVYLHKSISGSEVTLYFDHVGGGLVSSDGGALSGFAIAGDTGDWVWGNAEIRGETVVVSSPTVPSPTRVRYAWGDNPILSLYNADGLPAPSFTTESEDLPSSGTGGTAGAGSSTGTGGSFGGTAGVLETGGSGSSGGAVASGGSLSSGGTIAGGGTSTGGAAAAGATDGAGGAVATGGLGGSQPAGGSTSTGGVSTTGGAAGSGGIPSASGGTGSINTGGAAAEPANAGGYGAGSAVGGTGGTGLGSSGAAGLAVGADGTRDETASSSDSGCGCSTAGRRSPVGSAGGFALWSMLMLAGVARLRFIAPARRMSAAQCTRGVD